MFKFVLIFLISIYCVQALTEQEIKSQWEEFKVKFERKYDAEEEPKRFELFVNTLKRVVEHNALFEKGESSFQLAINQFADRTDEELSHTTGLVPPPEPTKEY